MALLCWDNEVMHMQLDTGVTRDTGYEVVALTQNLYFWFIRRLYGIKEKIAYLDMTFGL